VKLADVEPGSTDTVCGTVSGPALLERLTVVALATCWFKLTVQFELVPLVRDVGLHETLLTPTAETVVTVPPLPVTVTTDPSAAAPTVLVTDIEVLETPAASDTVTFATTPLDIRFAFRPARMQM
jgi:hypothetical protein